MEDLEQNPILLVHLVKVPPGAPVPEGSNGTAYRVALALDALPGPRAWGELLASVIRHVALCAQDAFQYPINKSLTDLMEALNHELETSEASSGYFRKKVEAAEAFGDGARPPSNMARDITTGFEGYKRDNPKADIQDLLDGKAP